jgi:hypothetical protein
MITVMTLQVPWNVWKFLSNWATDGFSKRAQLHGVSLLVNDGCRIDNLRKRLRKSYTNLGELKERNRGKRQIIEMNGRPSVATEAKSLREYQSQRVSKFQYQSPEMITRSLRGLMTPYFLKMIHSTCRA